MNTSGQHGSGGGGSGGGGQVIVTTIGRDRPGIVEEVSGWILEHGGNIEDSRMTRLGGEFATLILAAGPPELSVRLRESSADFGEKHGLTAMAKPAETEGDRADAIVLRYELRATSLDHPGIIHQVAQLLSGRRINIVSADTHRTSAPFSGAPVFQFEMEIDVPADVPAAQLRDELRLLGDAENIDFVLQAKVR